MTQTRIKGMFNLQPYVIDYSLPAMQVWKNLPEKFPAEVIDNKLYVSPYPTYYHGSTCKRIYDVLANYVARKKLGEVWFSDNGVYPEYPHKTVVAPDLFYISRNNKLERKRRGFFGVPDMVVEVLSPSNRKYDLTTKKDLYERTGVKEAWFIDPITKNAQGYLLTDGKYGDPLLLNSEIHIRILKKTFKF